VRLKAQDPGSKVQEIKGRRIRLKRSLNTFLLLACALFFLTHQIQAFENSKNTKAKLTLGYDDNVSDLVKDVIKSKFLQFYLNSSVITLPTENTLFSLKLQDGFKYHDAPSLSHESILINNLNFYLSHNLNQFIPELSGEIRSRTSISGKDGTSPSEVSYLRGYAGLALKAVISSDLSGKLFYNYRAANYEDFDPFDRWEHEFGAKTDIKLLPNSMISLQYSRDIMSFYKWSRGIAPRNDATNVVTAGFEMYNNLLLNVNLSYEDNRSSADVYSYKGYTLSAMLAKSLTHNIVIEIYGLFRSRNNTLSSESVSEQMDIEDEEKSMIMVKVSRDITEQCALEAQYDMRRNQSEQDGGTYTKNVFSLSVVYRF
jgi:hypothetical protein